MSDGGVGLGWRLQPASSVRYSFRGKGYVPSQAVLVQLLGCVIVFVRLDIREVLVRAHMLACSCDIASTDCLALLCVCVSETAFDGGCLASCPRPFQCNVPASVMSTIHSDPEQEMRV